MDHYIVNETIYNTQIIINIFPKLSHDRWLYIYERNKAALCSLTPHEPQILISISFVLVWWTGISEIIYILNVSDTDISKVSDLRVLDCRWLWLRSILRIIIIMIIITVRMQGKGSRPVYSGARKYLLVNYSLQAVCR